MNAIDKLVISRRQAVALGLGVLGTGALAACGSDDAAAPATSASDAAGSDSASSSSSSSSAAAEIDAEAFDSLVASGPKATDEAIQASTWATKVKDAGTFRLGAVQTSALFSQLNEVDNRLRGFDAGLAQLLVAYILGDPTSFEVTLVQSSTRESVLQNDTVDAVFATYSITDDRKKVISFAGPYFTAHQGILVLADNQDINSVDDLAGKTVGVQEGSTGRQLLEQYAPDATAQELGTDSEIREALGDGRLDAYVVDETLLESDIVENPGKYRLAGTFGPDDPYGIGLPKDSDGVAFVNDFLKTIEDDGTWKKLWQISIGDRIGQSEAPEPPAIDE